MDSTTFYRELACAYDVLFPLDKQRVSFVLSHVEARGICMDLGCATGTLLEAVADSFERCLGVDLSDDLLDRARDRLRNRSNVELREGDLQDVEVYPDWIDLVLCLGNTLSHLETKEDVRAWLADVGARLNQGGAVIVQVVNWTRAFSLSTPTLVRGEYGLDRRWVPRSDGLADFFLELSTNSISTKIRETLLPLYPEDFLALSRSAGYESVALFGDFKGTRWTPKSGATIAVFRK